MNDDTEKPLAIATVNIEEEHQTLMYVRIDPEVVKRIENIERLLEYLAGKES